MKVKTIYKLLTAAEWEAAWAEGVYRGSEQDQRDGFIHLSTAAQIAETARKHFSGVPDLVVLAIDIEMLEKLHTRSPLGRGSHGAPSPRGRRTGGGKPAALGAVAWRRSFSASLCDAAICGCAKRNARPPCR